MTLVRYIIKISNLSSRYIDILEIPWNILSRLEGQRLPLCNETSKLAVQTFFSPFHRTLNISVKGQKFQRTIKISNVLTSIPKRFQNRTASLEDFDLG